MRNVIIITSSILVVIAVIIALFKSPLVNRTWRTAEYVPLINGDSITINEWHSDPVYHDVLPHVFGFSTGYDVDDRYSWEYNGKKVEFDTKFIPIVYGIDSSGQYVVVFDRESDFSKTSYRIYRLSGETWLEIKRDEFPRNFAAQNSWMNQQDANILKAMDVNDMWFRRSLTGKLWIYLKTGLQFYESEKNESDIKLFKDYISENSITPVKSR